MKITVGMEAPLFTLADQDEKMLLLQANSRPNVVEVVTYCVDIYYLLSGFSLYDIIPETVLLCEPSAPGYRRFGTESKPFTEPEAIWVRSKNPTSTNII